MRNGNGQRGSYRNWPHASPSWGASTRSGLSLSATRPWQAAPDVTPRVPVCYLAPWVDYGGSDKGTIDWFRWLDRDRFAPSLITTQPSDNRRLAEVARYAEE